MAEVTDAQRLRLLNSTVREAKLLLRRVQPTADRLAPGPNRDHARDALAEVVFCLAQLEVMCEEELENADEQTVGKYPGDFGPELRLIEGGSS